jgi:phosphoribosylanthranilate isomerase
MMVKICGITNPDDALAAVEGGAAALGFNFWPGSPRYIAPEGVERLFARLPAGVWKVGLFVNEAPARVESVACGLALDVVQIHGDGLLPYGLRVWRAMAVTAKFIHGDLEKHPVEAFVLDAPAGLQYGGTGRPFDWQLVAGMRAKIILAGGLDAGNVREAIRVARPWGVDACSKLELAPGRKDHKKMAAFLKAALAGDTE